ncbi:hypothetical protein RHGRI_006104 [Rhododendron griersonianum]|uniref:Uncharacterized protein n=1 Tax=Rhododendron griersonianum TaxID=479676 RepID=A0AAV6LFU9_9ERIC|nr:hypothetical protein RHGRI_006104 [Rhododendron griersonianum]
MKCTASLSRRFKIFSRGTKQGWAMLILIWEFFDQCFDFAASSLFPVSSLLSMPSVLSSLLSICCIIDTFPRFICFIV